MLQSAFCGNLRFAKERLCFGGGGAADNHSVKARTNTRRPWRQTHKEWCSASNLIALLAIDSNLLAMASKLLATASNL